jgi:prepilin-type N-terminal cleavage/methylation domain-containing protein
MRMSTAGSSEHGFTLIELIVVMALISLTVSFAVPQIRSSLYTNELNSAVRCFVGVVAEIGQEARLKRAAVVLRYDRQQRLFTTAKGDGEKNQEVRLPDSVQVTDIDAAHRSESTELSISFDQRGYTDRMAVYFRHDNGDEQTVLLSPFLGSVRIVDGHVSLDDTRLTLTR